MKAFPELFTFKTLSAWPDTEDNPVPPLSIGTTGNLAVAKVSDVIEFADNENDDDNVFEDKGIKLIINPKSYVYLKGTQVDFAKEGINEGFKFINPNVKDTCGCGESFNV